MASLRLAVVTPCRLGLVALLNGIAAPELTAAFSWCHLGCGDGTTALYVAERYRHAAVWGCDPSPLAVSSARRAVDSAGARDVVLELADLGAADEVPRSMPERFDMVVVDRAVCGTEADRGAVLELLRERLAPGGLVVVRAKALAGNAPLQHVESMMRLAVHQLGGVEDTEAVETVTALLEHLRELGAHHLVAHPLVRDLSETISTASVGEVVDRFFGAECELMSHARISAWLAPIGCAFVGSARLTDGLDLHLPEPVRQRIAAAPTRAVAEALRDLATSRIERVDVFQRGLGRLDPDESERLLRTQRMLGLGTGDGNVPEALAAVVERWVGEILEVGDAFDDFVPTDQVPSIEWAIRVLVDASCIEPVVGANDAVG